MKLEEALRSGKRFRRKGQHESLPKWLPAGWNTFDQDDVLADDWEIEREPREFNLLFDAQTGCLMLPMCKCMAPPSKGPFGMIKVREVIE